MDKSFTEMFKELSEQTKLKTKLILQIIALIIIAITFLISCYKQIFSSNLIINASPSNLVLYINEKEQTNITRHYEENFISLEKKMMPGEYYIKLNAEGFEEERYKILLLPYEESENSYIMSSSVNNVNNVDKNWADAFFASPNIEELLAIYLLPINTTIYNISAGACSETIGTCIFISTSEPKYLPQAIERFYSLDNDIGKYDFEFQNYTNPFEGEI